jgi:HEAT repeat protein
MRLLCILLCSSAFTFASVDRAREVLSTAATHKEGNVRKEAAVALSLAPSADPVSKLLDSLMADKDYQVRSAAVSTLGELRDPKRLDLVKKALEDEVPEVSYSAAQALYVMKQTEGREALEEIFFGDRKAKSGFFKRTMMDSWRQLKTPKTAIIFGLQRGLFLAPVPGLGFGFNAMMGILNNTDLSVRALSLLTLCEDAKSAACPGFVEMGLKDEDWTVRAVSLHVASDRNMRKLLPQIGELLEDKKDAVQFRAAAIYVRFSQPMPARPAGRAVPVKKK